MINKILVFNFYLTENWGELITNKIHLECLKKYSNCFDGALFFVVVDDINNNKLITNFKKYIINSISIVNISFVNKENDILREARNFYDEIALKLGSIEGLLFFGHNKGITNYNSPKYDNDCVEKWITSMYYGCLSNNDELVDCLYNKRKLTYGTLLNKMEDDIFSTDEYREKINFWMGKRKYHYMGTFFWMNCQSINSFLLNNNKVIPPLTDRWYAENFFSNLFDIEHCASFNNSGLLNYFGQGCWDMDEVLDICLDDKLKEYYIFHNSIMNLVYENRN
jgi:hypothetical protein